MAAVAKLDSAHSSVMTRILIIIIALGAAGSAMAWERPGSSREWVPLLENKKSIEDLSAMRGRGRIRVLVTFSKTDFFLWQGEPRGFETELLTEYESFLNTGIEREEDKTRVVFVPVPFARLIPALLGGEGDIAASGLTITPQPEASVAFTNPYLPDVDEVVVCGIHAPALGSLRDLAGKTVYVLGASSYEQHLRELNRSFQANGWPAIEIIAADENLSDTDILELVNAGIISYTVIDNHLATLWSGQLENLVVYPELKVNEGGRIGWAVREGNHELLASLNEFIGQSRKGTELGNILFRRYFESEYFVKNPLKKQVSKRLNEYTPLFKAYAERYGLDWVAVAAQAYQESGFDNSLVSAQGAVGMMQMLPSTAADPNIAIADISGVEDNIHAAVKYLAFLRQQFFADEAIPRDDRLAFMWAAYNAGPERVRMMRERATEMGLDPNRWFFNVENAAQWVAGPETVRHVANVYKYYVAYKLSEDLLRRREREIESISNEQAQLSNTSRQVAVAH